MAEESYIDEYWERAEQEIPKPERGEDRWDFVRRCHGELSSKDYDSGLASRLCAMRWDKTHPGKGVDPRLQLLAESVARVWKHHVDGSPLLAVEYVTGEGILRAAVKRDPALGGYRMVVQKHADLDKMLGWMFHEMAHEVLRMYTPALRDVKWETIKAASRGEPDAVRQIDFAGWDDATEDRCNRWAEATLALWREPVLAAIDGRPGEMLAVSKALDAGRRAAEQAKATHALRAAIALVERRTDAEAAKAARRARGAAKAMGSPAAALKAINGRYGVQSGGGKWLAFGKAPAYLYTADIDALDVPDFIKSVLKRRRQYMAWLTELIASGAYVPAAA